MHQPQGTNEVLTLVLLFSIIDWRLVAQHLQAEGTIAPTQPQPLARHLLVIVARHHFDVGINGEVCGHTLGLQSAH